jgi:hypothetical protein
MSAIGESDSNHLRSTDRHVRIGREIEVDLNSESDSERPVINGRVQCGCLRRKSLVDPAGI